METGGTAAANTQAWKSPHRNRTGSRAALAGTVAALLLTGFLAGCAGVVKSAGTGTTIQAAFQLNPNSISFGRVNVGKQTTQTVAVTNTGNTNISITQVSLSNPQFSVPGATFPVALAIGQSANMTVAVTPTAAGTVAGTLTAQGDNGSSPVTVNLSATAVNPAPQISLSSTSVQLGTVAIGSTSNATVSISNVGSADLTVSLISLTGAEFGVSGITTPKTITAGTSSALTLSFQPTSAGAASGTLTITSNDSNTPTTKVTLNGTGTTTATATLQATPTSLSFGNVSLGGAAKQNVVIKNTGTAGVQISAITVSGAGVSGSGVTTPLFLNPSATASVNVTFAPTSAGSVTGGLTIASNATGSPLTVPVTGTGVQPQPALSISPGSFAYGSVVDGQTRSQAFTLTNTGSAALTISQLAVSGAGFSTNGLATPATVAAGGSTTFNAVFRPTTVGNLTGTVTVTSNAPNSPASIALSGTGLAAAGTLTLSTSTVSFGTVTTGSSATQNVTITNTGNASVQISQVAVNGTGFTATGITAPLTLNPAATTTLSVKFAPTAAGSVTGSVRVTSNAMGSPQAISLSGTGIQAALGIAPTSFAYGSVTDGQVKSQSFTLTNTGTGSLTISQIAVNGAGYSVNGLATPTTLAAGANATFNAVFAPTTAGTLNGTVTITSNAPGSPATVALSGIGVAATVTLSANPTSLSFGSVSAGSSSSQNVTLTNTGNSNVTISQVIVAATDTTTGGLTLPVTLTPGQTKTMSVTFSPKAQETVSGNVTVSTTQGASAVLAVTGTGTQAKLALTPSSANLGSVTVGSSSSQTIQVSNPGNAVLTITQTNISGAGFSTSDLTLPLSVNPGLSSTFNVVFRPAASGTVSGSVSIVSNAAGSPTSLPLSGTGVTAALALSFSTNNLAFGTVNTGSSATQSVTVTNTGNSNVQISAITASGTGYSLSGASTPVTLSPSQNMTFSVIFAPTTAGSSAGTVTVTSNATGSPATITLSGTGVTTVTHTVNLSWTASTTSGVAGYNVYRSTTSGTGYVKLNGALVTLVNYADNSVANGTTYFYVTTAVDGSGNESTHSNEATAIIP